MNETGACLHQAAKGEMDLRVDWPFNPRVGVCWFINNAIKVSYSSAENILTSHLYGRSTSGAAGGRCFLTPVAQTFHKEKDFQYWSNIGQNGLARFKSVFFLRTSWMRRTSFIAANTIWFDYDWRCSLSHTAQLLLVSQPPANTVIIRWATSHPVVIAHGCCGALAAVLVAYAKHSF